MAKLSDLSDLKKLFPEAEGAYTLPVEKQSGIAKQYLEAHFSNKGRGGKTVTLIKGFEGSPDALKALAKTLKQHCGVGGSVKDYDIIIQGSMRDKIMALLKKEGHQVKRVGG